MSSKSSHQAHVAMAILLAACGGDPGVERSPSDASDETSLSWWLRIATPSFDPAPGTYGSAVSVTILDATAGTAIYYTTDGETPTGASTPYTGPVTVGVTATLKAIATKKGSSSAVATGTYTIQPPQVATPTFDPAPGSYGSPVSVTITDATPGASIYYTTDGTIPTTSSTSYAGPIAVGSTTTVEAIAVAGGYSNSAVATAAYSIQSATSQVAAPTFSPDPSATYDQSQAPVEVTLSDATSGAAIYYTVDGTTPTTASTLYTSPIPVSYGTTIRAFAVKSGLSASDVATGSYFFGYYAYAGYCIVDASGAETGECMDLSTCAIGGSQFCTPGESTPPTVNAYCGPVLDYQLCWF